MSSSPTAAVSNRRKRWSRHPRPGPQGHRPTAGYGANRQLPGLRRQPRQRAGQRLGAGRLSTSLINNAGHGEFAPLAETREAQFDGLFNVHVKGVFFLVQTLLPLLADGGRIVNFSSGLTRVSYPGFSAYAAAKAAVEMLSVYMARELGGRGITVNTIAPGAIATDFGGGLVRDDAEVNAQFAAMTALGRVGVPEDIGPMIASLLRDDNRWVTAQRIEVSGGQTI